MTEKKQIIREIKEVCREINAPVPLMLAIASVETGGKFNNPNGSKYVGVFQLSNGYGGCKDKERLDVKKSVKCTWNQIKDKKQSFIDTEQYWEDWFGYMLHQQGLSGFKEIWHNRHNKLSAISQARQNAIKNNLPTAISKNIVYVSEYTNYWKNRIESLMREYTDTAYIANVEIPLTINPIESVIQLADAPLKIFGIIFIIGIIIARIFK